MEDNGSVTRVAAFPIGIDPERFTAALETEIVKEHMADLRERFTGRKVKTTSKPRFYKRSDPAWSFLSPNE